MRSGDFTEHLNKTLLPAYTRRFRLLTAAVDQYLVPLGIELPQDDRTIVGGYFVWFALPAPLKADDLTERVAKEESVIIAPGSLFGVYGDEMTDDLKRKVRLCFSWEEEDLLEEGVKRLALVVQKMLHEAGQANPLGSNHHKHKAKSDISIYR